MNTTVPATKARKNFFQLIKQAKVPGSSVTISVEGEPSVVMMSVEEFEGWQETLEIMSDPKAVKGIKEGAADIAAGRTVSLEEIEKELNLK